VDVTENLRRKHQRLMRFNYAGLALFGFNALVLIWVAVFVNNTLVWSLTGLSFLAAIGLVIYGSVAIRRDPSLMALSSNDKPLEEEIRDKPTPRPFILYMKGVGLAVLGLILGFALGEGLLDPMLTYIGGGPERQANPQCLGIFIITFVLGLPILVRGRKPFDDRHVNLGYYATLGILLAVYIVVMLV
jgi:hypothetical protein